MPNSIIVFVHSIVMANLLRDTSDNMISDITGLAKALNFSTIFSKKCPFPYKCFSYHDKDVPSAITP